MPERARAPTTAAQRILLEESVRTRLRKGKRLGWGLLNIIEGCSGKKIEQTEHEFEHNAPRDIKEIRSLQGRNHMKSRVGMSIQS